VGGLSIILVISLVQQVDQGCSDVQHDRWVLCRHMCTNALNLFHCAANFGLLLHHRHTLEIVSAGLHCSLRMSRQMLPWLFTLGW
jgi:hypothetical protein